jgi:hypothetical protein
LKNSLKTTSLRRISFSWVLYSTLTNSVGRSSHHHGVG